MWDLKCFWDHVFINQILQHLGCAFKLMLVRWQSNRRFLKIRLSGTKPKASIWKPAFVYALVDISSWTANRAPMIVGVLYLDDGPDFALFLSGLFWISTPNWPLLMNCHNNSYIENGSNNTATCCSWICVEFDSLIFLLVILFVSESPFFWIQPSNFSNMSWNFSCSISELYFVLIPNTMGFDKVS